MRSIVGVVVVALALAACGDDQGPKIPEVDGRWQGSTAGAQIDLTLNESDGSISGAGTISAPGISIAISADGVHSHPTISMTWSAQGYEDSNFTGEMEDRETIRGEVNGSGFQNNALTLRKQ